MARIGVLIGPYFEDVEYTEPAEQLVYEGHELVHISNRQGAIHGKHKTEVVIDTTIDKARVTDYDALFIPGGFSPDQLRVDDKVVHFVQEFMDSDKPVFAICHGPQLLISADRVTGRTLTAWKTVQKDLEYTGATVKDEPVVVDGNLITSRNPDDIPLFIEKVSDVAASL